MKRLMMICLSLLLGACAGATYRPLIDSKNVDFNKYERDLGECQAYAQQLSGAASNAAAGAIIGGLFGVALAAVAGRGYDRGATGRVGALGGAVSGGAQGDLDQKNVIRRCLQNRGYSVLQ